VRLTGPVVLPRELHWSGKQGPGGSAGVIETVGGDLGQQEDELAVRPCDYYLFRRVTRFPPNASAHGGSGRGEHRGGGTSDLQGTWRDRRAIHSV
jgi:hypothetical protein